MSKPDSYSGGQHLAHHDLRDQELFARFVGGDQLAFKELYGLYERSLMLYCQYLLKTSHEAQEVFQETWMRLLNVRRRGENVEHFRALLFTIARNTALKHLNSRKNSNDHLRLSVFDPENERLSGVDGQFNELDDLVNRALKRLPEPQREAFVLHSILGYTFHEIAKMQNCTMTGAKTRAFRARAYLRKLLSSWLALAEEESEDSLTAERPSSEMVTSFTNNDLR